MAFGRAFHRQRNITKIKKIATTLSQKMPQTLEGIYCKFDFLICKRSFAPPRVFLQGAESCPLWTYIFSNFCFFLHFHFFFKTNVEKKR